MATHSRNLAWRIPWTEELGGLQSMRSQTDTTKQLNNKRQTNNNTYYLHIYCGLDPVLRDLYSFSLYSKPRRFCYQKMRHLRHNEVKPSKVTQLVIGAAWLQINWAWVRAKLPSSTLLSPSPSHFLFLYAHMLTGNPHQHRKRHKPLTESPNRGTPESPSISVPLRAELIQTLNKWDVKLPITNEVSTFWGITIRIQISHWYQSYSTFSSLNQSFNIFTWLTTIIHSYYRNIS